ncbi:MAG: LysR family transcriptional regulator [Xanthomonadaceae bacterium]|nr:LysR family transcriptional regulator [Xanthomonadaceae bacterium]
MMPSLRHLHLTREIVRLGSVSAVSRRLHLSQPAVTQAVANVERYFGTPLFMRESTGMKPTPAGQVCAHRIERATMQLREGLTELLRRSGRASASVDQLLSRLTNAQLNALTAFTRHGAFTRAAHASGIAEPTLHRAARTLERTLGVALFERTSYGVRATRDAEAFSRCVRLAFAEIGQAHAEIDGLRGTASGITVIGAMPLARSFLIPSAVIEFKRDHPQHEVSIIEGTYEHLVSALQSGEADFLIGALRDEAVAGDVKQEHLFYDPLSIALRSGHPLTARKRVRVADLAAYPWIMPRSGSPLRAHFESLFAAAGVPPPAQTVQCNSLIAARAFLLEGDYLMLSSTHQIHYDVRAGLLAALPHPGGVVTRSIGLTMRRNWQSTPAQSRLLDVLREVSSRDWRSHDAR